LGQPTGGKQPSFRETDIQGILEQADRLGPGILEAEGCGILLPLQMKCLRLRDLSQMNFHEGSLPQDAEDPKKRLARRRAGAKRSILGREINPIETKSPMHPKLTPWHHDPSFDPPRLCRNNAS
jgi:hypothetical protein